jgi:hypothetical protein
LRAWRERLAGHARRARGERGEHRAAFVLEAHGYAIRARQAQLQYSIEVDGRPRATTVVADFVVERNGERLIAEVKTGRMAPRVERAETRRQLLEYQLATGTRCVLLVDPDARTISQVAFPLAAHARPASSAGSRLSWVLLALSLALAAFGWSLRGAW